MQKVIKIIKIINLVFIGIVGVIFILGSGFTLLGLFSSSTFRIMFGGYLVALIFGLLTFKKDYFLILSLIGWVIFIFIFGIDRKEAEKDDTLTGIYLTKDTAREYLKMHDFCETTTDCVPVITRCNSCSHYVSVINKEYKNKYEELLLDKCSKVGSNRICDAIPKVPENRTIECLKGKCQFVAKRIVN